MTASHSWLNPGYGDIEAAEHHDGLIEIRFANRDVVELEPNQLGLSDDVEVEAADGGAGILATNAAGTREIDWMVVRATTDAAFAQELRDRDADEAKRIGRRLRALRENRDMSQRTVANVLGMSPPQLAKLEQGDTDMRISTLRSLLRALGATFADISGPDAPELSVKEIGKRAQKVGVPSALIKRIAASVDPREMLDVVTRGFGWEPESLLAGVLPAPGPTALVKLKGGATASEHRDALLALAESLARRSSLAYAGEPGAVPSDPAELRRMVIGHGTEVTLEALLEWCWRSGIIVVPMEAPGGFSACASLIGAQPVVVLKEAPNYKAYWLFALAHELGHLACGHVEEVLVDTDSGWTEPSDPQEREANRYALELLVPGYRAMLDEIRQRSAVAPDKKFKFAARNAAAARGFNAPLVTLVAAFGLPDVARTESRWGSAINDAKLEGSARAVVAAAYERNVDLDALDRPDAQLLRAVALG